LRNKDKQFSIGIVKHSMMKKMMMLKYIKTLIKIQALAVYAQEDEEWSDKFFKRRMR